MNDPSSVLLIANVTFVVSCVALALLVIWLIKNALPKVVRAKYPHNVVRASQWPFTEEWRKAIDPVDLPLFVRARKSQMAFLLGLLVLSHVRTAYAHLHTLAVLQQCQMARIDDLKRGR